MTEKQTHKRVAADIPLEQTTPNRKKRRRRKKVGKNPKTGGVALEPGAPFDDPRPKQPPGRISRCTKANINLVAYYVRAGNYLETAAAAANLGKSTLHNWLQEGRKKPSSIYGLFVEEVEKAMAVAEARDVMAIGKAGETQWQALAWRLERKHPAKWGRRITHDVTVEGAIDIGVTAGSAREKLSRMLGRHAQKQLAESNGAVPVEANGATNGEASPEVLDADDNDM